MTKQCPSCGLGRTETVFYSPKTQRCVSCQKTHMAAYRAKSRLHALLAYGGEVPTCDCPGCGENRLPFLTIDHIEGGGNKHRRELAGTSFPVGNVKPGGGVMYRWLKQMSYPQGHRVLCYNCNVARGVGKCPVHEI
jgi:hypothetical protein